MSAHQLLHNEEEDTMGSQNVFLMDDKDEEFEGSFFHKSDDGGTSSNASKPIPIKRNNAFFRNILRRGQYSKSKGKVLSSIDVKWHSR